jgi:hypothetical protein
MVRRAHHDVEAKPLSVYPPQCRVARDVGGRCPECDPALRLLGGCRTRPRWRFVRPVRVGLDQQMRCGRGVVTNEQADVEH